MADIQMGELAGSMWPLHMGIIKSLQTLSVLSWTVTHRVRNTVLRKSHKIHFRICRKKKVADSLMAIWEAQGKFHTHQPINN